MKTVIADKIASIAQHLNLKRELRVSADIPCEEGVVIAAEVLNNKSTYNQLELTSGRMAAGQEGRHRRRRARPPEGAVRLLGTPPGDAGRGRHAAAAEHGRRHRRVRLHQCQLRAALRCPGAGRGARLPLPRRAHRRAGADRHGEARCRAGPRHPGRAGGGHRRHLHELRQDRRRLRHREPAAAPRAHGGCLQGHRRVAAPGHPGHGRRRRARNT